MSFVTHTTKLAQALTDHDLVRLDGDKLMVDWTVGLDSETIRVGFVPRKGGSPFHRDLPRTLALRYDGRA